MGEIRGTYLKNGNITEIYLPNGITEIQCDNYTPMELDVPDFANANKIKPRRKIWTTKKVIKEIVLILSVMLPYFFFTWKAVDLISDHFVLALGFLMSQIWLMIFLFANERETNNEQTAQELETRSEFYAKTKETVHNPGKR